MNHFAHGAARFKLLALGITAVSAIAVSAGAMSLALFTDDATVDSNSFQTGTIVISTNPTTALFSVTAMMPGDSASGQLSVSNDGSAELRYSMTTSATDPDSKALAAAVNVEVREKAAGSCSADFTGSVVLSSTALDGAAFGDPTAGQDADDRVLSAAASENLCFRVTLPSGADNSFQGAATVATFTFNAEQTANNS